MSNIKILLAEDDLDFGNMLVQYLKLNSYDVVHAKNGAEAWKLYNSSDVNLCILDVMMPEIDGFEVFEKIKQMNSACPVVFLTAKGLKDDKIKGLKLGADDYITKPFDPDELMLRIHNILRRYNLNKGKTVSLSSTTLYYDRLILKCVNNERIVTSKERDILAYLMESPNKVIMRNEILTNVWGDDDYFLGRSMDVFISRIRKYLANDKGLKLRTVRGEGFILEAV